MRTLISIDLPTKKNASVPVARGPVPRMRRSSRCILRSYRTLASCSCCDSIDIQVLADLAFILCILQILDILIQTETQQAHREKVWKTLMSIERRRNTEKRSVRTLISIDLPTKKTPPGARSARACPSQCNARQRSRRCRKPKREIGEN